MKRDGLKQGVLTTKQLNHPDKYVGKHKDNIVYRSSWEFSFIKYLDTNPNIKKWWSEETIIIYKGIDGRAHRYYMDFTFWVDKKNGMEQEVWVEIKPYFQTIPPVLKEGQSKKLKQKAILTYETNKLKWSATQREAQRKHIIFKILTEKELFN